MKVNDSNRTARGILIFWNYFSYVLGDLGGGPRETLRIKAQGIVLAVARPTHTALWGRTRESGPVDQAN